MCTLFNNQQHSGARLGRVICSAEVQTLLLVQGRDSLPGVHYSAVPACSELPASSHLTPSPVTLSQRHF